MTKNFKFRANVSNDSEELADLIFPTRWMGLLLILTRAQKLQTVFLRLRVSTWVIQIEC